jgi:ribosomal protein RSM22 (predicted rRNA methylase)
MLIEALWQRVKDDGVFVMIEPGSPKGFRFISSFRDWVVAKDRSEASIVAPCPHHNKCPLASKPDSWCHFSQLTQKVPKKVFPKLVKEPELNNEKFSYLVVKKGVTPNAEYATETDAKTPLEKSYFWPRIIRPVIIKQKHSIMDLCNSKGDIERRIIAKSHGLEGGYKKIKRVRWGDLWYFEKRVPHKFRKEGRFGKRLW